MAEHPVTRDIPVGLACSLLSYDPATGALTWRESRGCVASGQTAGATKDRGYVVVRIDGVLYYGHRVAWVIHTGQALSPEIEIDHRDGDPSNNRWSNLRLATPQQNKRNMRTPCSNTSGEKGVTFRSNRGKWQAQISVGNTCRYLGSFDSFEDAVAARRAAEVEVFGPFSAANRKDSEPCLN